MWYDLTALIDDFNSTHNGSNKLFTTVIESMYSIVSSKLSIYVQIYCINNLKLALAEEDDIVTGLTWARVDISEKL